MKTAYELAMERLNQAAPATKLTGAQKKQLAELDSTYAAKIAGREIALKDEIAKPAAAGDAEKVEALQQQLVKERKSLQAGAGGEKGTNPAPGQTLGRCCRLFAGSVESLRLSYAPIQAGPVAAHSAFESEVG